MRYAVNMKSIQMSKRILPDLQNSDIISIDIETNDPSISAGTGPGTRRGGYIIGISICTDKHNFYLPVAHNEGENMDKQMVYDYLSAELSTPIPKVGANILYDLDYMKAEGIEVSGPFFDVTVAEALIDENQPKLNLDHCANKYLGHKKDDSELRTELDRRNIKYGTATKPPISFAWLLPPEFTESYAMLDTELTLEVHKKQVHIIEQQHLIEVYQMECDLIPLLLQMIQTGVRLDGSMIPAVREIVQGRLSEIDTLLGGINYNSSKEIAALFETLDLPYGLTAKGNPSFTKEFLITVPHAVAENILLGRKYSTVISNYLDGSLQTAINGRIHASLHPVKGDFGGTGTGRFSMSNPNLQQIPKRDKEILGWIRPMFKPDEGHLWGSLDYSQIEYRFFAHYARGPQAERIRDAYIDNPDQDFHQWCADLAGIDRDSSKQINFGLLYGMGEAKLARSLPEGVNAKEFFEHYHGALPFIKFTSSYAMQTAQSKGFVRTILGRRRRFDMWESVDFDKSKALGALRSYRAMEELAGTPVRRAYTYKALNAVLQGSAADLMKKAMVQSFQSGIFDRIIPLITVHDEMNCSVPDNHDGREAFDELKHIMENAIELRVPVKVDGGLGKDWKDAA